MLIRLVSVGVMMFGTLWSCGSSAAPSNEQSNRSETAARPAAQKAEEPAAAADPNKFALVIAGVGGEDAYSKKFVAQAAKLYEALTKKLGFPEKQTFLLTESGPPDPENDTHAHVTSATARSTAQEVRNALQQIKGAAKPESQVLVVLIGHGSFDSQQAKFNLVGPDLSAKDYATLLDGLPTEHVVFLNCASSSGEFVKPLSKQGRVVVTATRSGNEQNITIFADHLIDALTDAAADADKNGRTSLLEAFNYATKVTADWYKEKDRLATEHALLDDNGDGVGHETATAGDGVASKAIYLDSKPLQQAGTDAELGRLLGKKQQIEEAIEKLKARKEQMKQEEYDSELERLLIDLAKLNQDIKAHKK